MEGIDYHETFSPIVHMDSVRMVAQVMVEENMLVHQMDFHHVFLNSDLDMEIYIGATIGLHKRQEQDLQIEEVSLWPETVRQSMEQYA